jgi:predicted protein tyrosine phosphatase
VGNVGKTISERSEAPAMLNLEEINRSEEDLMNSYDPSNPENNYHLPNHLNKRCQMAQYRQACSEVVPGAVYISSYKVPSDWACLKQHQITHIVNMAADVCENMYLDAFSYLTYYMKDSNSEDLTPIFYRTLEWMQKAIDSGGRVLVHCREGVSRSATMVLAYLMWRFKMTFDAALESLQKVRPICNPNTGFTCQLLVLGKKLGVSRAKPLSSLSPGASVEPSPTAPSPLGLSPCTPAPERKYFGRVAPHDPREPFFISCTS